MNQNSNPMLVKIQIRPLLICVFIWPLIISSVSIIKAEMPSNEYDKLEKNAPEYIQIKIIDKKIFDKGDCLIDIEYVALVTGVSRSKSNLQINDKIYIYSWLINRNKSCDAGGPQPPKTLSIGWNGNAYLKNMKRKGAYEIAALKKSFEDLK